MHDASMSSTRPVVLVLSHGDRDLLAKATDELGNEMPGRAFFGLKHRRSFATYLNSCRPLLSDEINYALGIDSNFTDMYGANRNAAQLLTIGCRVLSADDDTFCNPQIDAITDPERLIVSREGLTWTLRPHVRDGAGRQGRTSLSGSLIDLHGRSLGVHARNLSEDVPENAARMGDDVVHITCNGATGHPGMEYWRKFTIDSLLDGRPTTDVISAIELEQHRHVVRQPITSKVTRSPAFMTTCYAFNNQLTLPPFVPRRRGEDGLFFQTFLLTHPNALIADLAVTVDHLKPNRPVRFGFRSGIRFNEVLSAITEYISSSARENSLSLRDMGSSIENFLGSSDDTSMARIRELIVLGARTRLQAIVDAMSYHIGCPILLDALNHEAMSLEELCTLDLSDLITDVASNNVAKSAIEECRLYARLLGVWSEIRDLARASEPSRYFARCSGGS